MKRIQIVILISLSLFIIPVLAHGYKNLEWVMYNVETGETTLSGSKKKVKFTPGQFVEIEDGYPEEEEQWRSPLDMEFTYKSEKANRVVFSHERHFAALGEKSCSGCHEGPGSIGSDSYLSAPANQVESHKAKSIGRFCSGCHNGSSAEKKAFTAYGKENNESCGRCHAPDDHRKDYTGLHGEHAERKGSKSCNQCHRGSDRITDTERKQAESYRKAQLLLIKNPEDPEAFKSVLPNNFCAYCHNSDDEAWEHD